MQLTLSSKSAGTNLLVVSEKDLSPFFHLKHTLTATPLKKIELSFFNMSSILITQDYAEVKVLRQ